MKPKLSVVISCYNLGSYILEAVNSVLSYPNQDIVEIVIVNDGSNDNGVTKTILDQLTNINITIIHQENKGLGNARNVGVRMAKAPYVLVLDADNMIRHNYITEGIKMLDAFPNVGVIYGDNKQFGLKAFDTIVGPFNITKLLISNYIDACVVLRKSAWLSVNGYDEKMPVMGYEDWDMNLRLFFKGWEFKYINEILFDYRVRDNSMLENTIKNVVLVTDYMFAKPELHQAKLMRDHILAHYRYKTKFEALKGRKIVTLALKFIKGYEFFVKLFKIK